jgi:subtilisin family serine protease
MPKFKKIYRQILLLCFILALSVPGFSQEATEEPALPTESPVILTEEAAPTEIIAPTLELPTLEPLPTEESAPVEPLPTEETTPVEVPVLEPTAEAPLVEVTVEAPIPTAAPQNTITPVPAGNELEMILRYNINATEASIQEMLRSLGAVELERIPQLGVIKALIPSSVSNLGSARSTLQSNTLAASAGLLSIEPNIVWQLDYTPNDTYFNAYQTNLKDSDGTNFSIQMESAWQTSPRDGLGVTVAVLDTGVDIHHPEFIGKLLPGWNFYDDIASTDDFEGHGTHVAGVIAARTNNGIGVAGIAYNAMILPVKVCGELGCFTYEIAAGIIYAVDRGARVINMSLGGPAMSTTVQGAINYALSRNVVVVASAGNDGDSDDDNINDGTAIDEISYPASYPGVISVAAVDPDGLIAAFSSTNDRVTVAAPGVDILSTVPLGYGTGTNLGYDFYSGTSMASPHVAGLAAMLIADGIATTPATVREALTCSARETEADLISGYDNAYGFGLIHADAALTWNGNSGDCQVAQPNDLIQNATVITTPPFSIVQPVSTRSVTSSASDPMVDSQQLNQTLWYRFTPLTSGQFLFSTIGSGDLSTLLAVYEGQPGALREIANGNDSGSVHALLRVSLTAGLTYYVQLGTPNMGVESKFVQLTVNPALTLATLQQENATFIRYTGTWNRIPVTGSSAGYVNTTTDGFATATFIVRGTDLVLTRLVGPTQGSMNVYVDGLSKPAINNLAAVTRSQTTNIDLGNVTGEWHIVILTNAGSLAPISIDAVQTLDGALPVALVGAIRLNENAPAFLNTFSNGAWPIIGKTGALLNDVRETSDAGAYVQFRTSGTAISIFRSTGNLTGTMDIYLDNVRVAQDINNTIYPVNPSVPFTIANLAPRERVVRVVNISGTLDFDGAQAFTQAILAPNLIADERNPAIVYSGIWTRTLTTLVAANAATLSSVSTVGETANASFMFNGNHLCVAYQRFSGGGNIQLYIDDSFVATISTLGSDANKVEWCTYNNGFNTFTDTNHRVNLLIEAGQSVRLDYVRPVRRTVFTSSMGYITETNPGFIYNTNFGIWTTTIQRSSGGASFQGGSARRASITTLDPRLNFTLNGTGFILYTSLPAAANASAWEVYVDGTLHEFTLDGDSVFYLDLWAYWNHFRPLGIGVIDLPLGIHYIELRGIQLYGLVLVDINPDVFVNVTSPSVDFDGIRVLP